MAKNGEKWRKMEEMRVAWQPKWTNYENGLILRQDQTNETNETNEMSSSDASLTAGNERRHSIYVRRADPPIYSGGVHSSTHSPPSPSLPLSLPPFQEIKIEMI